MAATYSIHQNAVAWASSKNMMAVYNGAGSGKIVRIYRIQLINNQTGAVTGGIGVLNIGRFTGAYTGGTGVTINLHNTTNAAVPAQVVAAHAPTGITLAAANIFRTVVRSTDEVAVSGATLDELNLIPAWNYIWEAGHDNTTIEPITLREGEGLVLQSTATGTYVGTTDINIEMTIV